LYDGDHTVFCGAVEPLYPPILHDMYLIGLRGIYHLHSDMIYIFLQHRENWDDEGVVDTIIHEDIERAVHRIFWEQDMKARSWSHLAIKINQKTLEMRKMEPTLNDLFIN